jgi:hypothetical protein
MLVKAEVATTVGACDLVGCSINRVAEGTRVRVRQASKMDVRMCGSVARFGMAWWPLHDRLVFVELKLSRVSEVFHQAYNRARWGEAFAAMPDAIARRSLHRECWERYGVGLLAVGSTVEVLVPARLATETDWQTVSIVDRFWRERKKLRRAQERAVRC